MFRELLLLASKISTQSVSVLVFFIMRHLPDDSKTQILFCLFCSFTIIDVFGCSIDFKLDSEYYIFASHEEYNDGEDPSTFVMDFAVDPTKTSTPTNFVQRMKKIKEEPPQCEALPVK